MFHLDSYEEIKIPIDARESLFSILTGEEIGKAELKSSLMLKIRKEVQKQELTHKEVADLSGVGRTVVTGIMNCSIQRITIDRLVRVLSSLGIKAELKYKKTA